MVLSQLPANLDAEHLREACAALLATAKQLLEKTQALAAMRHHKDDKIPAVVDLPGSAYSAEQESSPSTYFGDSSDTSLTPADSATGFEWDDCLTLNVSAGGDCHQDIVWQSNGVRTWHEGDTWSGLSVDEWPCIPG